ncbi:MAG: DUF502 domain-containing protein [Burkholderiales bacterium]
MPLPERKHDLKMKWIGKVFATGLLTVLPVMATVYFTLWLLGAIEYFFGQQLKWLIPDQYYRTGMGLVIALGVVFGVGLLMHAVLFRRLFQWAENLLLGVPLVRSVYTALRDLFGLIAPREGATPLQVVSVTLPGGQMRVIGFVTRTDFSDLPEGLGGEGEVAVYLPMAYMIGGYTVFVPRDQVRRIDMSREEAMKFVLTAGLKSGRNGSRG